MFKRMVSTLLVICIIFSTSVPVFAQDSISTDIQNEQNKIVSYIGEYKLVLWELGNIVYAEQYDSQGTLIVSGNANKTNGEINIFNNNTYSKFNATEIVETISTNLLPTTYSFKRVGTYTAWSALYPERYSMYLYEDQGSATHTTYSIRSFSGTIASLVLGIAAGLIVPASIASKIVTSIISAGFGLITGEILNIGTKITLAADKYNLKYYGQDSETRKKSKTYDATYKYIITDEESKKLNEVYYTTNAYYDPAEGPTPMLMQFIVPNLYGTEYEWAQSI